MTLGDGANLYKTVKALGFDIDYKRLLREFRSWGTLVRAYCYTTIVDDQEYSSMRPLIDWLDYNCYRVVTKTTKEFIDAAGRRKVKGNTVVKLAVHAMELAEHMPADRRWLRMCCAAKPTASSISLSCGRSSAVIPSSVLSRAASAITRPNFLSAKIPQFRMHRSQSEQGLVSF
jgi:hypothetical protein